MIIRKACLAATMLLGSVTSVRAQQDSLWRNTMISGRLLERLPVGSVQELLGYRPGTFPTVGNEALTRGVLLGSTALYLDGVPLVSQLSGSNTVAPPLQAIGRARLTSAAVSAAWASTRGGTLLLESRTDRSAPSAGLRFFTDELSGWSAGSSRLEAHLNRQLTQSFGLSAALMAEGNRSSDLTGAFARIQQFRQVGIDTVVRYTPAGTSDVREVSIPAFERVSDGGLLPKSANDLYSAHLRADWQAGASTNLFAAYLGTRDQQRAALGGGTSRIGSTFRPESQNAALQRASVVMAGLDQKLGRVAGGDLQMVARLSHTSAHSQSGLLEPEFAREHADPALGFTVPDFKFLVRRQDLPIDDAYVERHLRNQGRRTPFEIDRTDLYPGIEFRLSPYGTFQFYTQGLDGQHEVGAEAVTYGRIAAQLTAPRHQGEVGIEYSTADVAYLRTPLQSLTRVVAFVEQPRRAALYAQGTWNLGRVQIEAGVRYDRFDPNALFPVIPGYFNLDEPASYAQSSAHSALSPNLSLHANVAKSLNLRVSYAQSAALPDARSYYNGKNNDFFRYRNSATSDTFGKPIGLARSSSAEVALTRSLSASSVLQLIGFRVVDTEQRSAFRLPFTDPTNPGSIAYLNVPTLMEGPSVQGLTVRYAGKSGEDAAWDLAYTLESVEEEAVRPPRHSLVGYLVWDLGVLFPTIRGTALGATARLTHGHLPSNVRLTFPGFGTLADAHNLAELNLRLTRALPLAGSRVRLTLDTRNLLGAVRDFEPAEQIVSLLVEGHRLTVGAGNLVNNINLASLAQAGDGVRNEVDLAALRQTERLFGNGDGIFSAEEQTRAFSEAVRFQIAAAAPSNAERRLRLGVEIVF